ncbi:MAG TPA: helix-turn-helix transcriptional regulator [Desulfosporosinus sp.]|nr:helix-turn-helix transcriptional regulator [Desulfosporosinus sp.]
MIGDKIKKLRARKAMTQKQLAEKIGVSTSMIGMYETNDRKPSYNTLTKIANHFRVSTDYLLGNTKDPQQHIITDDELPDILRPFLKKDSSMVVTLEESEDDDEYSHNQYSKTKAIENALKSMNVNDFPEYTEILNLLPNDKKGITMSVYELLDIVGNDQHAMQKLTKNKQKDQVIIQPKEKEDINRLFMDPQINAIAKASQKLSPEKRDLLLRLAESMMIDEANAK